jgi:hypothetical protein
VSPSAAGADKRLLWSLWSRGTRGTSLAPQSWSNMVDLSADDWVGRAADPRGSTVVLAPVACTAVAAVGSAAGCAAVSGTVVGASQSR